MGTVPPSAPTPLSASRNPSARPRPPAGGQALPAARSPAGGLLSREALWGYAFIAPWLVGFFVFTLGPFVASLYLSFTDYKLVGAPSWVGLKNYVFMFSSLWSDAGDGDVWVSLRNTVYYTVFHVPLSMLLSFVIALLLNAKVRGMPVFRTMFFLPSVTAGVATAILWLWILSPTGLVNYALSRVGIPGPGWFGSFEWAMPGLILISLWSIGGTVIIYLAGLQGVPQQLYEAASIDGAGWWHRLRHVTIPMMTPTIFFTLVIGIIASFQVFTPSLVITNGGPGTSTLFYLLHLYRNGFRWFNMGYASALAWVLFVIILGFTLVQLRLSGRWVYYEGEARKS
jgi:multiple sugar transport system permease protein